MTDVIERMTSSVPSWGAKLAFGERIVVGGQEVVPSALVIFGFGGGGGSGNWLERGTSPEGRGEGSGAGGGGYVLPIGAYIGGSNGVRFYPNPVAMLIVSVPLLTAAGWAVARIINATTSRATN